MAPAPVLSDRTRILGLHHVLPMAYRGEDMMPLQSERAARVATDAGDAAALMDMAMILQSTGQADTARVLLTEAVALQKDFCVVHGDGSGPRLLAFVTPGDFMANTPVDFLLNGSDAVLWLHYVDADTRDLATLPDHDVALVAVGEAPEHGPVLDRLKTLLPQLSRPVLNNAPQKIADLSRDGVSAMFADEPSILAPATHRIDRATLEAVSAGRTTLSACCAGLEFPIIVRPVGTHAGGGLERAEAPDALPAYLAEQTAAHFYVAPFIDYRGPDGLFSKQRIVVIDGRPYPSHLALSDHWIVHYLSAGMAEDAAKRAVEAAWMESFDTDFARRHADAFDALNRRIGLDYFGIDCAELPDGRLLVFEADIAMVVHDMDDVQTFPYKKVAMRKLFDAFMDMVRSKAGTAQ